METKTSYTTKTRTLKDGTVKKYRSKYSYKTKGNAGAGRPPVTIISDEQRERIWKLYLAGVKKKDICSQEKLSYAVVKKTIDSMRPAE